VASISHSRGVEINYLRLLLLCVNFVSVVNIFLFHFVQVSEVSS
jgi:hypothetical protein